MVQERALPFSQEASQCAGFFNRQRAELDLEPQSRCYIDTLAGAGYSFNPEEV